MCTTTTAAHFEQSSKTALIFLILNFITGRSGPQNVFHFSIPFFGKDKNPNSEKKEEPKKEGKMEEKIEVDPRFLEKRKEVTNRYLVKRLIATVQAEIELLQKKTTAEKQVKALENFLEELIDLKKQYDERKLPETYLPGDYMPALEELRIDDHKRFKKLFRLLEVYPVNPENNLPDFAALKYFRYRYAELGGKLEDLLRQEPLFVKYQAEIDSYKPKV